MDVRVPGQVVEFVDISNAAVSSNDVLARYAVNGGNNDDTEASPHWVFSDAAVTRYWVALADGVWADDNNWSLSSGGPPGAPYPAAGDKAVFDDGSQQKCTLTAAVTVMEINSMPA